MSKQFFKRTHYPYKSKNTPPLTSEGIEKVLSSVSLGIDRERVDNFFENIKKSYDNFKKTMSEGKTNEKMLVNVVYVFPKLFTFISIRWRKAVVLPLDKCMPYLHHHQLKAFKPTNNQ